MAVPRRHWLAGLCSLVLLTVLMIWYVDNHEALWSFHESVVGQQLPRARVLFTASDVRDFSGHDFTVLEKLDCSQQICSVSPTRLLSPSFVASCQDATCILLWHPLSQLPGEMRELPVDGYRPPWQQRIAAMLNDRHTVCSGRSGTLQQDIADGVISVCIDSDRQLLLFRSWRD